MGGVSISQSLTVNVHLTSLNLALNQIGPIGGHALATVLADTNRTLTRLDVSGNMLGDDGVGAFSRVVRDNRVLVALNVSGNTASLVGVGALAATIAQHNVSLTHLVHDTARDHQDGANIRLAIGRNQHFAHLKRNIMALRLSSEQLLARRSTAPRTRRGSLTNGQLPVEICAVIFFDFCCTV